LVKATKDEQEYSPFSVLTNVQTQACLEDYLATWKQINFTKNTTKHYAALFEEWFKYNTNIPLEDVLRRWWRNTCKTLWWKENPEAVCIK